MRIASPYFMAGLLGAPLILPFRIGNENIACLYAECALKRSDHFRPNCSVSKNQHEIFLRQLRSPFETSDQCLADDIADERRFNVLLRSRFGDINDWKSRAITLQCDILVDLDNAARRLLDNGH